MLTGPQDHEQVGGDRDTDLSWCQAGVQGGGEDQGNDAMALTGVGDSSWAHSKPYPGTLFLNNLPLSFGELYVEGNRALKSSLTGAQCKHKMMMTNIKMKLDKALRK